MIQWLLRRHVSLFLVLNVAMDLVLLVLAPVHGVTAGHAFYVCLLFGLCTAPLIPLDSFNGRYSLLLIFMFTFFMHFGGMDAQFILLGQGTGQGPVPDDENARLSFMTSAEVLVLLCGALVLAGYLAVAGRTAGKTSTAAPAEWPAATMLTVGLAFWIIGTAAEVYLGVFVVPESGTRAMTNGLNSLGLVGTFLLMLGRLMQPLGLLILSYAYAKYRGTFWTVLIIAIVLMQAMAGFVTDVKTTALMGVVVVVVTRLLVDNGPPKAWIASAILAVALAFPVFQANRLEVSGERGLNHLQAFQNIGHVLKIAIESRDKVNDSHLEARPPTFVERVYIKNNLQQVMDHLGVDVPYLNGESLKEVALAFVPRLVDADKQSISMGQLFTHQIVHSEMDTYISISHIGELYWNFGWLGTVLGMLVTGAILGAVGGWSNLAAGRSLTHVMVLLTTVQSLCIGFEGEISISYVNWLRSLVAILLLHLVFARASASKAVTADGEARTTDRRAVEARPVLTGQEGRPVRAAVRYPNLMR